MVSALSAPAADNSHDVQVAMNTPGWSTVAAEIREQILHHAFDNYLPSIYYDTAPNLPHRPSSFNRAFSAYLMTLANVGPAFKKDDLIPALVSYERGLKVELSIASANYKALDSKAWRGWAVAIGSAAMRATRRSGKELGLEAQIDVVKHFLVAEKMPEMLS